MVELEMAKAVHELYKGLDTGDLNDELLDIIKEVGPGGNFMAQIHTLNNFRKTEEK